MKKIISLVLVLCMVLGLTAVAAAEGVPADQIKVGFIFIGDENEGYTYSHYKAAMEMKEALGLTDEQILIKRNTPKPKPLTKLLLTWLNPAATSSSPTPSATRATCGMPLPNIPKCSSATPPVPRLPPAALPTLTTTSPLSMKPATSAAWSAA